MKIKCTSFLNDIEMDKTDSTYKQNQATAHLVDFSSQSDDKNVISVKSCYSIYGSYLHKVLF